MLVDSSDNVDSLKLKRLEKMFENNKTIEEKQKNFWEILRKEKLNLKEFQALFNKQFVQENKFIEEGAFDFIKGAGGEIGKKIKSTFGDVKIART